MSGVIGEIVDGVTALVTGGMKIDDETRKAAKQSVRDTLARASELDRRSLLSTRADAVDARHIARVRAMASAVTPIQVHAAVVEELVARVVMPPEDRESIEALIAHARGPAVEHEERTARSEDDTREVVVSSSEPPR